MPPTHPTHTIDRLGLLFFPLPSRMLRRSRDHPRKTKNKKRMSAAVSVEWQCGACERGRSVYALYACKACGVVQCGECVAQTISAYFCPQCLAPYASRQAHELDSRCRRCAHCPRCMAPLQTAPTTDPSSSSSSSPAPIALVCPHCRWSSAPARLWATPAALAVDALKLSSAAAAPWADEFASILAGLSAAAATQPPTVGPVRSLYVRGASAAVKPRASSVGARAAAAAPPFSLDDRVRRDAELANSVKPSVSVSGPSGDGVLREPAALASVAQRNADVAHSLLVADLRERRVRLETRCTKRCCACNTLLVKPDKALDVATFSERNHTAVLVLPFVTAAAAGAADVRLTFENTSVAAMSVSVLADAAAAPHVLALAPVDDAAACRASLTLPAAAAARDVLCTVTSYEPPIPFKLRIK